MSEQAVYDAPTGAPAGERTDVVRIRTVERAPVRAPVSGLSLDLPRADEAGDVYDFVLQGWVMSTARPPTAVELTTNGRLLGRIAIDVSRPDIAELYPEVEWAVNSGFRTRVSVLRLPTEFELDIHVVLQDSSRHPVGTIRGKWRLPPLTTRGSLQPILLTTLGRTGSTWATRLLGAHPAILAYRPFEYEPRLASYWMEMLAALADPYSYTQALRGDLGGDAWWLGRRAEGRPPPRIAPGMDRWLGMSQVEELLPFCVDRIESFYRQAGLEEPDRRPSFFVEKYSPQSFVPDLLWELYPGTSEIMLVRDFRDMICSIFAYNRKRGVQAFGRELASGDAEYIARIRTDARQILDRWQSLSDRAYLLRYEDMVREPAATMAAVFEHVGVEHDPEIVESILESARRMTPDAQRQHATTPDPVASIGRWRHDLSDELKRAANEAFGDILAGFGYEV